MDFGTKYRLRRNRNTKNTDFTVRSTWKNKIIKLFLDCKICNKGKMAKRGVFAKKLDARKIVDVAQFCRRPPPPDVRPRLRGDLRVHIEEKSPGGALDRFREGIGAHQLRANENHTIFFVSDTMQT